MWTLGRVLDVVLPPSCGACGLPGPAVCARCRAAMAPPPEPLCRRCGHPAPLAVDRCPACPPSLARARQACLYGGPVPPVLRRLKDEGRRDLAVPLAEVVAAHVPAPAPGARLVPVPVSPRRRRARGFNQAREIARPLGALWGLPLADVLSRERDGAPQRGASRAARRRQVAGVFATRPGRAIPRHAVLVDDVHTTGATLAACARVLRAAGSRSVSAVCVARVADVRLPIPRSAAYDVGDHRTSRGGSHEAPGEGPQPRRHRRALRPRGAQDREHREGASGR